MNLYELRTQNISRMHRWHDGGEPWTGADWSNAMCGEAGEGANVVKKLRRIATGLWPTNKYPGDSPEQIDVGKLSAEEAHPVLVEMLANELADVITYADLLAAFYGIDLELAIVKKFNRVSLKQGFPERLDTERMRPI